MYCVLVCVLVVMLADVRSVTVVCTQGLVESPSVYQCAYVTAERIFKRFRLAADPCKFKNLSGLFLIILELF